MQSKIKTAIELAKENPQMDTDKLMSLIGLDFKEEVKEEVKEEPEDIPMISIGNNEPNLFTLDDRKNLIWTEKEVNYLMELVKRNYSYEFIADQLKRTVPSVQTKHGKITRDDNEVVEVRTRNKYTKEQNVMLRAVLSNYNNEPARVPKERLQDLSDQMNVSKNAIKVRMYRIRRGK